jgi:hypothetical protein
VKQVAPSKGHDVDYSTETGKDHTPLSSLASTTPRVPRRSATSDEALPGNTNLDCFTVRRRSSLGKEEQVDAAPTGHVTSDNPEPTSIPDGEATAAPNNGSSSTLLQSPFATPSTSGAGLTTPGSVLHAPSTPFGFMRKFKRLGSKRKLAHRMPQKCKPHPLLLVSRTLKRYIRMKSAYKLSYEVTRLRRQRCRHRRCYRRSCQAHLIFQNLAMFH